MLVTDVGDEVCWQLWWWRFWPFLSPTSSIFQHNRRAATTERCHQYRNSVTNIQKLSPRMVWRSKISTHHKDSWVAMGAGVASFWAIVDSFIVSTAFSRSLTATLMVSGISGSGNSGSVVLASVISVTCVVTGPVVVSGQIVSVPHFLYFWYQRLISVVLQNSPIYQTIRPHKKISRYQSLFHMVYFRRYYTDVHTPECEPKISSVIFDKFWFRFSLREIL